MDMGGYECYGLEVTADIRIVVRVGRFCLV
jgi:hypothetical protein